MRYIVALFLALSLLPTVAKADLIPDNSHHINNCLAIENIGEYPDYDFVWATSYRVDSATKITNTEPLCDQRGGYKLIAIKKTDWSKVEYPKADPNCPECATEAGWAQDPKNSDLFITSNYAVNLDSTVPDTNSAVKQTITVHIDSASTAGVTAHTASTLSTDNNNAPVEEAETGSNLLTTSAKVLIAIGLFGLGYMIAAWKKK